MSILSAVQLVSEKMGVTVKALMQKMPSLTILAVSSQSP